MSPLIGIYKSALRQGIGDTGGPVSRSWLRQLLMGVLNLHILQLWWYVKTSNREGSKTHLHYLRSLYIMVSYATTKADMINV